MADRARKKAALRIAIVILRRRIDGVTFGVLLSYLYWGSLLLQCGDVESNPGPPMEKDSAVPLRQTRMSTSGTLRKANAEKTKDPRSSASASPAKDPTLHVVMATLTAMRDQMGQVDSKFESKFDELKRDVHSLREDYAALQHEVKGMKDEVTELKQDVHSLREDYAALQHELKGMKDEVTELRKENRDLCGKLDDCEKKIDDLEGRSKRNNLLFYGLPRRDNETSADCEGLLQDLLTDKLEVTEHVEFDRVHRLSPRPDSPVIARCTFYRHKVNILKAKRKLKGSNIFIGEDFSKGVRDLRRKLTPHMMQARKDGKRATLVFNYLLIDGKRYTVDVHDRLVDHK